MSEERANYGSAGVPPAIREIYDELMEHRPSQKEGFSWGVMNTIVALIGAACMGVLVMLNRAIAEASGGPPEPGMFASVVMVLGGGAAGGFLSWFFGEEDPPALPREAEAIRQVLAQHPYFASAVAAWRMESMRRSDVRFLQAAGEMADEAIAQAKLMDEVTALVSKGGWK